MTFILFNTESQLVSYIKRKLDKPYCHYEGCGCCGSSLEYHVNSKGVLFQVDKYWQGDAYSTNHTPIGRIKKYRARG